MRALSISLLAMALIAASALWASMAEYQATYDITGINGTGSSWRVVGVVGNDGIQGFSASDAVVNDLVFCFCANGDIDAYLVTNIVSVSFNTLTCDVVYMENGTPRSGQPEPGYQIICRTNANGIAYLPSETYNTIPEYLRNGARNLNLQIVNSNLMEQTASKRFVSIYSGEQVVNAGGTITPYGNVKVSNTNTATITLGVPQIATNNVSDGMMMYLRGATNSNGIQITNGGGLRMDCGLNFLLKSNDVMQLVFMDGAWTETKRVDQ
jgi:hypothetical protein